MKSYPIYEYQECVIYDHSISPQIQIYKAVKDNIRHENLSSHIICIFMEGVVCMTFPDDSKYVFRKGQMIFVPTGSILYWKVLEDSQVLIYRLLDPGIKLCDNFPIEKLYHNNAGYLDQKQAQGCESESKDWFSLLDIHPRLWQSLECTRNCIADGIKCKKYFEMEIEHFFLMIRFYYNKKDLYKFLHFIVTGNLVFTEFVRLRWRNSHTVRELAESMHLTPKYFIKKFKQFFGQTPHLWMANSRAQIIYGELISTTKPLKQIASENGFSTSQQFAVFVKKMLGKTPTEIRRGSGKYLED